MLFAEFEQQVTAGRLPGIPDFDGQRNLRAYYGLFRKHLPQAFAEATNDIPANNDVTIGNTETDWEALAKYIDQVVSNAVAEFSITPQAIESGIRQQLLPALFRVCKTQGAGMEAAKAILEDVIKITRHQQNGGVA